MSARDGAMVVVGCAIGLLTSLLTTTTRSIGQPDVRVAPANGPADDRRDDGVWGGVSGNFLFSLPGQWCPEWIERSLKRVEKGQLIIDGGSYDGQDAVAWASQGHTVITIEPTPRKIQGIRNRVRTANLADNITILHLGLSNETGEAQFNIWKGSGQDQFGDAPYEMEKITKTVKIDTLDNIVGDRRAFLVKIDCQGHEPAIIQGARRLLSSGRVAILVMEVSPLLTEKWREYGNAFRFLHKHGYSCFDCEAFARMRRRKPRGGGAMDIDDWLSHLRHNTTKYVHHANVGLEMNVVCFLMGGTMGPGAA